MTPLLEQFLSESRDFLQGIGEKLMELEKAPEDAELMTALFRMVHTLKGNSGLFEFPEMTRVLHAGEDLMDGVRHGRVSYSKDLADRLLDAMDFVGMLCDEVEADGGIAATHAVDSARLAESLRQLIAGIERLEKTEASGAVETPPRTKVEGVDPHVLLVIPETLRMDAYRRACGGDALYWLDYIPTEECFFQGDDPFFQVRGTPDLLWGNITTRQQFPILAELDPYRCELDFHLLTAASHEVLVEHYRYVPDQIRMLPVPPLHLALPQGNAGGEPAHEDFVNEALILHSAGELESLRHLTNSLLERASPDSWLSSALRWLLLVIEREPKNHQAQGVLIESLRSLDPPQWAALELEPESPEEAVASESTTALTQSPLTPEEAEVMAELVAAQRRILTLPIKESWQLGRIKAVAAALSGCLTASGDSAALPALEAALAMSLDEATPAPLLAWLNGKFKGAAQAVPTERQASGNAMAPTPEDRPAHPETEEHRVAVNGDPRFGRRAEDTIVGPKSLKVDQAKIDRLMNLIGEMVVSKNSLPYLAGRAETVYGSRELGREIKAQYAVINRIAEEMQDAIMQVRMMPVSFVFQRFPRLVRDTSRKLGKEVNLVLEGEDTEADKNIIESLGDPLVHIVRNSLDHGFELPEVRSAAGKPAAGTLTIRATQESDRVVIEISDDGKGIDPTVIKRKAYEKSLIDEAALERLSDQEAVNLVFASGFSTMEVVSDLSGRGVGMDVVRTAVEKVNGSVVLESEPGKGTRIRLSLPLSMAVTNVMIVESDGQIFGMPMDSVIETVRVKRSAIRAIKKNLATVLRGRIVPLKSINTLLGLNVPPKANADDELAVLVVRLGDESVGLVVDDFRETVEIILKPMTGVLAGLSAYSGSALMGDGSVLMVLNVKEIL